MTQVRVCSLEFYLSKRVLTRFLVQDSESYSLPYDAPQLLLSTFVSKATMASKEITAPTPGASESTGKIESSPAAATTTSTDGQTTGDTKQQQTITQKREIDTGFGKVIVHIQGNIGLFSSTSYFFLLFSFPFLT